MIAIFARELLSEKSGIDAYGKAFNYAHESINKAEAIEIQMSLDVWEVPEGYFLQQTCRLYIMYYMSEYFGQRRCIK